MTETIAHERIEFGKRLREAREASLYSDLASASLLCSDCTPELWQAWEAGESDPPMRQACIIARFLDVPIEFLCGYGEAQGDEAAQRRETLGENLKNAREPRGLTAAQVGKMLNVPASYWEEIEAGLYVLPFDLGTRACLLFGVPVDGVLP